MILFVCKNESYRLKKRVHSYQRKMLTMYALFSFLWFLAGFIIAIPYIYLASGNLADLFAVMWFGPIGTLILFFSFMMKRIKVNHPDGGQMGFGSGPSWVLMTYFCFPILLNGLSLLLKQMGHEALGDVIFSVRFMSLLLVPISLMVLGMIIFGALSLWQRFSSN